MYEESRISPVQCRGTESEQRYYELRSGSRSRSHTPLVQNRALAETEISDHHYDLRNRSRERSSTPGETMNSKRSGTYSRVHDQNMEMIMEGSEEITVLETSESDCRRPENSPISAKKAERRSERQKAKREVLANGQNEKKDISSGEKYEKQSKNIAVQRTITSDYSSEEGEKDDSSNRPNTAHEIYKQAGDWWNVFPKTDYTYSQTSQCRYEIAPGILAMPNMSRRSIHSDAEMSERLTCNPSVSSTCKTAGIKRDTDTILRSRQLLRSDSPLKRINSRKLKVTSSLESDTELDDAVTTSSRSNKQRRLMERFTSFVSIIILWFNKILEFLKLKTVRRRDYSDSYHYLRHESKWYKAWQYIDHYLLYVYIFMVKVFLFDTWLLSRVSNIRKWIRQRNPKVLWVALLPLLFLMGNWCLPYFSTSLLSIDAITGRLRGQHWTMLEFSSNDRESFSKAKRFEETDDFSTIAEKLHSSISRLEDRTIEQGNRLSRALERLRENDFAWSRLDNKILSLEKSIEDRNLIHTYDHEFNTLKELYSELKLCCNTRFEQIGINDLEKRIETILAKYIDLPNDLPKTIRNTVLTANDYNSNADTETKMNISTGRVESLSVDERVREIVRDALRIYDADKTGRVDYALESAGGQIISTRCTQRYDINTRAFKLLTFMLYHENNNPRTVIQGNPIQPGACWAFQGFPGYLLIKLRSSIYITGFTVEHAPKSILPNGEMRSAPKKFNVWGFVDENDPLPVMFGDYEFAATDDNLQYFPVQNTTIQTPYEFVELRVNSNHGQLDYTCLYRFRVHGRPV
nr:uncharacterized protein LOC117222734 isoform X1 [Megalopta genalis]XP_033330501.1 uncharacterized protein LOC117222734 isoform X2 [Megalopta genalis]